MFKWLHHALNPHCKECRMEREDDKICISCETLAADNDRLRRENEKLLEHILHRPEPEQAKETYDDSFKPIITNRHIPFQVRREMLEREDREAFRLRQQALKEEESATFNSASVASKIEKLEKELGVTNAGQK